MFLLIYCLFVVPKKVKKWSIAHNDLNFFPLCLFPKSKLPTQANCAHSTYLMISSSSVSLLPPRNALDFL